MIIISEYRLTDSQIKEYKDKGFRVAYGYENPKINKGEAVGFLLDTMYKSSIDMIEYLLFTKHKLLVKYQGEQYKLQSLDEWKHSYRENKRTISIKHTLLLEYEAKKQEYLDNLQREKNRIKQEELLSKYKYNDRPEDLDIFVSIFSRLYNYDVDLSNDIEKLICYNQLKTYIELDIPYLIDSTPDSIEAQQLMRSGCIDINEQDILPSELFLDIPYDIPVEVESFGNQTYLEDTIYKGSAI